MNTEDIRAKPGGENGGDRQELCTGRRSGVGRQDVSNRKQGYSESPSRALAVVLEAQYLIEVLHSEACGGGWASQA